MNFSVFPPEVNSGLLSPDGVGYLPQIEQELGI